ncbi:hypothetical protein AJ80_09668 [Polytolypa hystricis UAMH7299]|uniref:Uncharacterized protein n=1 Tax=Polytolypa hystricis (strain UAMH7299) TaxID=1447883 RepID=A0A2B7WM99_POLH7|nr:hypothetical protein AJ80_09668 [Polytolypa hystricis UAMH7299]
MSRYAASKMQKSASAAASGLSPRAKRMVLAGATALVVMTGTMWGAGLKMNQEAKQELQRQHVISIDEKIHSLEVAREGLVGKRNALETQIRELEKRQEERKRTRANEGREG